MVDLDINQEGNALNVTFSYETDAAAGQNMVTIVTDQILRQILDQAPHQPTEYYIEGNMIKGQHKITKVKSEREKMSLKSLFQVKSLEMYSSLRLKTL